MISKQTLYKEQPILYRILNNSFQSKKIPHAFLLVGQSPSEVAHFIAKSIICENDEFACCQCPECQRIEDHSYGDLIYANGKIETIKKNLIEYIQTEFSKVSLEGKSQIYLLENIENSTPEAMNSLLKILEEPTRDVYAIFTCQNIHRVLPTIQSRCQIIQLLPQSKKLLQETLRRHQLPEDDILILSELFQTFEECQKYMDTDDFDRLKSEVYHFMEDLYFKRENLMIDVQTHLLKEFKSKDEIKLFLNMLVLAFKDVFHVKHHMKMIYTQYQELFSRIKDTDENLIKRIDLVLNTEFLLETNANILLLMDSMMYRI